MPYNGGIQIIIDEWAETPLVTKPKMTQMNIESLRNILIETVSGLRAGHTPPSTAEAISNASGKIISTIRVQLEYARMRNEVPKLSFMEDDK